MSLPQMLPVESSNIRAAGVMEDDLFVQFHHGGVYRYKGAAAELDSLINAPSAGEYFASAIKDAYQFTRVS